MTTLIAPEPTLEVAPLPPPPASSAVTPETAGSPAPPSRTRGALSRRELDFLAVASILSAGAAAWMMGGLLEGAVLPRLLGAVGVVVGVGITWAALRSGRPAAQYVAVPIAAVIGAIAVAPDAKGGTANLPSLVLEAVQQGGLLQTPIPFDPGWRFIVVVFLAVVGVATLSVPIALRRPRLAVVVPLPMVLGAALLQPQGTEVVASTVAVFLVIAALIVSASAELAASTSAGSARFEFRRLRRGGVLLVLLMIGMLLLSRTSFLFPNVDQDRVIPAAKPQPAPLEADRVLMTTSGPSKGPWQIGVLSDYDGSAWLLPAVDPKNYVDVKDGRITSRSSAPDDVSETFTLTDLRGRSLPVPSIVTSIAPKDGAHITLDPGPGVLRLDQRIPQGFTYTATAPRLATSVELDAAPPPDARIMDAYGAIGPPPDAVQVLLNSAPAKSFDRLQYLRDQLYQNVVSAGGGNPAEITPARVAAMLKPHTEANPYEITAAEAMLARWAGVPSRIGFGYYGGDKTADGYSVHPRDGAAWLEAYFQGYGWVSLVGTPPLAKASLSKDQKNDNPSVTPSDELAIDVLIPIRQTSPLQLFEIVRYYIALVLPYVIVIGSLLLGYPFLVKALRRARRRRWAARRGPVAQTWVVYAELRDTCHDLNLGEVRDTPLEFAASFVADEQHEELAWLVTRLVWGDLRRDARREDADAAQALATSVQARILAEQTFVNRLAGHVSRVSLRNPYSDEVPNPWIRLRLRELLRRLRLRRSWLPGRRRRVLVPRIASLLVVALPLMLTGCSLTESDPVAAYPAQYPPHVVPAPDDNLGSYDSLVGYTFSPEPKGDEQYRLAGGDSLIKEGHVYTIRRGDVIQGSMQVSLFKPDVDISQESVRATVTSALGGGFTPYRFGSVQMLTAHRPEQRIFVWFPIHLNDMVVFVFRAKFSAADDVITGFVLHQRGVPADLVPLNLFARAKAPEPSPTPAQSPSPAAAASPLSVPPPSPTETPHP